MSGRNNNIPKGNSYEINDYKSMIPRKTIEHFTKNNIKHYEIRMKTKKTASIPSTGNQHIYKKDLNRFGDFMERYLCSFNTNSTEVDQAAFHILSKIANKKKADESHCPKV